MGGIRSAGPHATVTITFPDGLFRIDETTGEVTTFDARWLVTFDVWPPWYEASIDSMIDALAARTDLEAAHEADDAKAVDAAMLREMRSTMLCVTSAAFAFEAFTGRVGHLAPPSAAQFADWDRAGTRQPARVLETLRPCFRIHNGAVKALREQIKQLYALRNLAVHDQVRPQPPMRHDLLDVAVDRRYVMFRAQTAIVVAGSTLGLLRGLLGSPRPDCKPVAAYAEKTIDTAESLLQRWEAASGYRALRDLNGWGTR